MSSPSATYAARLVTGDVSDEERTDLVDTLWQVYGDHDIAPSYLAYLDEVCQYGLPPHRSAAPDPVRALLDTADQPCESVPSADGVPGTFPSVPGLCVAANPADPVVPIDLVETQLGRGVDVELVAESGHAGFTDLAVCMTSPRHEQTGVP